MKDNRYKDVHAVEIPKTAEIRDCVNNLWFVVNMKADESDYLLQYPRYCVSVYAQATRRTVEYRPRDGEKYDPKFGDYDFCRGLFDEYVRNYASLVKASTRGLQDMDVYAEKVGYRRESPRCCATCQFAKRVRHECDYVYGVTNSLECWNEENQEEYCFDVRPELRYRPADAGYHHFIGEAPPERRERSVLDVHPRVDPLAVCDHYVPRAEGTCPLPGQSIAEFIDQRMGVRLDGKIRDQISVGLTSDLSAPVVQAVTMVLSGPEAPAVLSAPVVSVVTNSPIVRACTICAVAESLTGPEMSSAAIAATAMALSSGSPCVSSAISAPLADAIMIPRISAEIVGVAERGIKLSAIYGGSSYKDDDGDGKPDPDSAAQVILGDLGA